MQYTYIRNGSTSKKLLLIGAILSLCLLFPLAAFAADNGSNGQANTSTLTTGPSAGKTSQVNDAIAALVIAEPSLKAGNPQTIGVVLNDENLVIESGTLTVSRLSDNKLFKTMKLNASGSLGVFTFDTIPAGSYYVSKIELSFKNSKSIVQTFVMDDTNLFDVSQSGQNSVDLGDATISVYDINEKGALSSETEKATLVESAAEEALVSGNTSPTAAPSTATPKASGPASTMSSSENPLAYKFVIALDPGHGGRDGGAADYGLREKDINLTIAKVCAEELRKYQNIEVYLTRENDTYVELQERVINAKNKGARVFVSIHINAAGNSAANGAEVFYPVNSSYYKNGTHILGSIIASDILNELLALGLTNRGIKTRESTANYTYADGSKADYYSVIYNSRLYGIPGLIVEHAFITNYSDATYMSSYSNLVKLGKADALGIAKGFYFADGYWYNDRGTWKYWTGSEYVTDDWFYRAGSWYWCDKNGKPRTGPQQYKGKWYFLDRTSFHNRSGWIYDAGKWYYGESDGAIWESWELKSGWLGLDAWYYLDPNEAGHPAKTGLFTVDGVKYYAGSDCRLVTSGYVTAGGKTYRAASDGSLSEVSASEVARMTDAEMKGKTGWIKDSRGWHYYKQGVSQTGWIKYDGGWFYISSGTSGKMLTGWQKIGGSWFYLTPGDSGRMLTGWQKIGGYWYYLKPGNSGKMLTGWQKIDGYWYYLKPGDSGRMLTGWQKVSGYWYYLMPGDAGYMLTGWQSIKGKWYYLLPGDSGRMLTGLHTIGGKTYYFKPGNYGHMLTGTITVDGTTYQSDSSGALTVVSSDKAIVNGDCTIMGSPSASRSTVINRMASAYKSVGKSYPSYAYASKGASTIEDFCGILYDEAVAEGVRPEVVFAQSMLETGWLGFGGQVNVNQCNFAGIGAVDGGAQGATFNDVRTGLRAQVQHLKAYASKDSLKNTCVDPRFNLVSRGCAPTVIYLGQKENPQGYGWATGAGYGSKIINIMQGYGLV